MLPAAVRTKVVFGRNLSQDTFLDDLKEHCKKVKTTLEPINLWTRLYAEAVLVANRLGARRLYRLLPMQRVIRKINIRFGSSVLGFYNLASWVVSFNLLTFVFWFSLVILPWFRHWEGEGWKDQNGNDIIKPKEIALNFIGANPSNRTTDQTWFFYSGYPNDFDGYELGGIYVLVCIGTYFLALVALTLSIGRSLTDDTAPIGDMKLPLTLYAWDWVVAEPSAVDEKMLGCWMGLQAEYYSSLRRSDFFQGQKVLVREGEFQPWKPGTILAVKLQEGYTIGLDKKAGGGTLLVEDDNNLQARLVCGLPPRTIRRIVGSSLSFILCGASLAGLYFSVAEQETMNKSFPYMSALVVKGINLVIPQLQSIIVSLEKIRDPREVIRQEVIRVFFIKMCGIVFLYMSIRDQESNAQADGQCPEFVTGVMLQQLLIVDCFADVLITAAKTLIAKRRAHRQEFKVSTEIINTLYRQCITWIGCLYCPMMPLIGAATTALLFFVKAKSMFAVCRTPSQPVSSEEASAFFQVMLLVSLGVAVVPLFSFVNTVKKYCGPHWVGPACTANNLLCETPLVSLNNIVDSARIKKATSWIFSPIVLFVSLMVFVSISYLLAVALAAARAKGEKKAAELDAEAKHYLDQLKALNKDQQPTLSPSKEKQKNPLISPQVDSADLAARLMRLHPELQPGTAAVLAGIVDQKLLEEKMQGRFDPLPGAVQQEAASPSVGKKQGDNDDTQVTECSDGTAEQSNMQTGQ